VLAAARRPLLPGRGATALGSLRAPAVTTHSPCRLPPHCPATRSRRCTRFGSDAWRRWAPLPPPPLIILCRDGDRQVHGRRRGRPCRSRRGRCPSTVEVGASSRPAGDGGGGCAEAARRSWYGEPPVPPPLRFPSPRLRGGRWARGGRSARVPPFLSVPLFSVFGCLSFILCCWRPLTTTRPVPVRGRLAGLARRAFPGGGGETQCRPRSALGERRERVVWKVRPPTAPLGGVDAHEPAMPPQRLLAAGACHPAVGGRSKRFPHPQCGGRRRVQGRPPPPMQVGFWPTPPPADRAARRGANVERGTAATGAARPPPVVPPTCHPRPRKAAGRADETHWGSPAGVGGGGRERRPRAAAADEGGADAHHGHLQGRRRRRPWWWCW